MQNNTESRVRFSNLSRVGELTGLRHVCFGAAYGGFGNAILSRYPFAEVGGVLVLRCGERVSGETSVWSLSGKEVVG